MPAVLTDVEVVLVDFGEGSRGWGGWVAAFLARPDCGERVNLIFQQGEGEESIHNLKQSQSLKLRVTITQALKFDLFLSSDLQRTQLFKEGRLFGLESKVRLPYLQFLNGGLRRRQK